MATAAWVTPLPPDRNGGGGQIRQAHLLLGLARRAAIHLICPGPVEDQAVREAVTVLTEVEPPEVVWRDRHPWLRRSASLVDLLALRTPREVRWFERYRPSLAAALQDVTADVVLVEFVGLAPLLPPSPARRGRWVLTFHNLPSRMAAQEAALRSHPVQRWVFQRDAAVAAAYERRAASGFDAAITCTTADAEALASPGPTLVVPNGVDVGRFRQAPQVSEPRVVLTGALYTAPNIEGARWLCHEVLPLVRQQVPHVQVDIVGARPTDEVRALGLQPGVAVHPDVADVAPFLRAARVAVVPLRIGSGSRLKALEAMAAGRPVVGTTIGVEGLDLQPEREVLIADDPAAFAAATIRLLHDDHLAASLAAAGRAAVEARFDWAPIAARFADAVLDIAHPAPAGRAGG